MVSKVLVVDPSKCSGCRVCENVCSFTHTLECNPARGRVSVVKLEAAGIDFPVMCRHCETPLCEKACPVPGANRRDTATGAMKIEYDRCIGCRYCMIGCPFGAISLDISTQKVIKCDLCDGDPKCAKWCPEGAISYVRADRANMLPKHGWVTNMAPALNAANSAQTEP